MSAHNDKALTKLKDQLVLNLSLDTGLGTKLEKAAGGFMDRFEAQNIMQQPTMNKKIDAMIELLRTKDDVDFQTFLDMLVKSNNTVWANELRRTANEEQKTATEFDIN